MTKKKRIRAPKPASLAKETIRAMQATGRDVPCVESQSACYTQKRPC